MKELLEMINVAGHSPGPMALATLVRTAGSTYRKAGARMLILPDARTVGCISGGCLDRDVACRALDVIKNQKPMLIDYDTSSDLDALLGVGVGCKGVMEIFLEFLPPKDSTGGRAPGFLSFLEDLIGRRAAGAAATVVATSGEIELTRGDRVTLDERDYGAAAQAGSQSVKVLARYAQSALAGRRPEIICHEGRNGTARIFVERILPQTRLVVVGAGHDAMPLARMANELGYWISVVDHRPEYVKRDRFPLADEMILARPEEELPGKLFDARTAAVIMSHNYLIDQAWLKNLVVMGLPYLGLMGPRKRAEKMLAELRESGFEPAEQDLQSLHNPIGLDIGAETPEQIALAILGEVQAALAGREGGKLREKKGAIRLEPSSSEVQCAA